MKPENKPRKLQRGTELAREWTKKDPHRTARVLDVIKRMRAVRLPRKP